jgi:alpha-beta hydrolase superfamily lysophospholipase
LIRTRVSPPRAPLTLAALAAALGLVVFSSSTTVRAVSQRINVRTDDGLTLTGTWYEPSTRPLDFARGGPAPAVILVHMLQKSRRDWDQFASRLASEGIGALAIDLRGHGDSPGSAQDHAAMVQDVRAARRFLASRSDVNPARIGVVGASIGSTLAALAAAEDASIATLVLLSPTIEYQGLRLDPALKKYGGRPVLLVASDDDGYALRTVRELQKAGGGIRETVVLNRAGHGTAMLARDQDLSRRLVEWLRRTLL